MTVYGLRTTSTKTLTHPLFDGQQTAVGHHHRHLVQEESEQRRKRRSSDAKATGVADRSGRRSIGRHRSDRDSEVLDLRRSQEQVPQYSLPLFFTLLLLLNMFQLHRLLYNEHTPSLEEWTSQGGSLSTVLPSHYHHCRTRFIYNSLLSPTIFHLNHCDYHTPPLFVIKV